LNTGYEILIPYVFMQKDCIMWISVSKGKSVSSRLQKAYKFYCRFVTIHMQYYYYYFIFANNLLPEYRTCLEH